jgi:cullin-4
VQGKDIFEAFYKKSFAKRLLMARSASVDIERSMISKLTAECGSQYTSKLRGMLKDEQISRDSAVDFKKSKQAQQGMPPGLEANVRVLTSNFWPTYTVVNGNLPPEIHQCVPVAAPFSTTCT